MTPQGTASTSKPGDEWGWLKQNPPLGEMIERYPALWEKAGRELVSVLEDGRAAKVNEYASRAKADEEMCWNRIRRSRRNSKVIESTLPALIGSRMSLQALEKCYLAAATKQASGKVRFNLVNGTIIQKLLFSQGLTRKPVSLGRFHFWWRLIRQKRLLMPLVQPKGIYCFYSRELLGALAALIGDRSCLEIGAGDGTLSRFLSDEGVSIRATDNHSWTHAVAYPESVERLDAKKALSRYEPEAVICSWPPPSNSFERHAFSTRSVELYVVVGSRYSFASGNWEVYRQQQRFEWGEDKRLSGYVIPPELDSSVLVFRRKSR